MIGSRVAAHFVEQGADVVVLDAKSPRPSRFVEGAVYAPPVDLGDENASAALDCALKGADIVVHTAGLVVLSHQPSLLRRVHVDGTRALVDAARRCGARAFVLTSTAGVLRPNTLFTASSCIVGADAPSVAPRDAMSCYGRSKARAERIVLRANDDARGGLRTLALRLPGVWGVGDNMIAEPLLRGDIPAMPVPPFWRANARPDGAMLDLLYVENAAAAHCAAAAALLGRNAVGSGRVFNVTNDEPREMRAWARSFAAALRVAGVGTPSGGAVPVPRALPYAVAYVAALCSEALFATLAGIVPFPGASFWNLTRATLLVSTCDQVLDVRETRRVLGFAPPLDNAASFADFARRVAERRVLDAASAELARAIDTVSAVELARDDPRSAVQWRGRAAANLFERLSGAGMTAAEAVLAGVAMLLLVAHVAASAPRVGSGEGEWSPSQFGLAVALAGIDGSACVQCTTATSKRHYHFGGRLSGRLVAVIVVETVAQLALVELVYGTATTSSGATASARSVCGLGAFTARSGGALAFAILATHYAPLRVQRAVAMLCAIAVVLLLAHGWIDAHALSGGMAVWFVPLLAVKYLISHVPRHEPYV